MNFVQKPKKKTAHKKVKPVEALKKHHTGKIKVQYIADKYKRAHAMCVRKKTLFGKAKELEVMCGAEVSVKLKYNGVVERYSSKNFDTKSATSTGASSDHVPDASTSDPVQPLSPSNYTVEEIYTEQRGVQADIGNKIEEISGIAKQCRVCGKDYDKDTKAEQAKWMGCEQPDCKYWLHASCLLGKSKKITKAFVAKLPYLCPYHREFERIIEPVSLN